MVNESRLDDGAMVLEEKVNYIVHHALVIKLEQLLFDVREHNNMRDNAPTNNTIVISLD